MGETNKGAFSINAVSNIYSLFNPVDLILQIIIATEADADCSETEICANLFKVFHKTDVNKLDIFKQKA